MKVALINMPFATENKPSIQLGILKSMLNSIGITSDSFYFNRDFARLIGMGTYIDLSEHNFDDLNAEWMFARKIWPQRQKSDDVYHHSPFDYEIRQQAEAFIDKIASKDWSEYKCVAFTCTFAQILPALCLGKEIKDRNPDIITVYGGANLFQNAAIEYVKKLYWVDLAFVGESEDSFPDVMKAIRDDQPLPDIEGYVRKDNESVVFRGVGKLENMDLSYYPDYSDFKKIVPKEDKVIIPYESSRGCWYGEKNQCKFCSLNLEGLAYRAKTPSKVLAELKRMKSEWPEGNRIFVVDNILDKQYIDHVYANLSKGHNIFLEVKPDLTARQLETLSNSGVDVVQPGIENFQRDLIKIQSKGQSVLNCISLLKWCKYYNIFPIYNVLYNIPFEKDEWIDEQLETVKLITHLKRPKMSPINVERYGVYYQQKLVSGLKPLRGYQFIYPNEIDLNEVAYAFNYDVDKICSNKIDDINNVMKDWEDNKKHLKFIDEHHVLDTRFEPRKHMIKGKHKQALHFLCEPKNKKEIEKAGIDADIVNNLVKAKIVINQEGKFLSLVDVCEDDLPYRKTMHRNLAILNC